MRREISPSKLTDSSDLADPRQLLAEQHVDDPRAADGGLHQHHSGVITHDFSDNLRVMPKRMFAHALQRNRRRVRLHDGQELPFIGHVEKDPSQVFRKRP